MFSYLIPCRSYWKSFPEMCYLEVTSLLLIIVPSATYVFYTPSSIHDLQKLNEDWLNVVL